MSNRMWPEPESEMARCRRIREERDRRFGTIEAALAHFAALERQGARPRQSPAEGKRKVPVARDARPVARLVRARKSGPSGKRKALFGCLKGKIALSKDFDAPLPDFDTYMR
jgi:antitoxin (DNA-binding transcriptional repressor) of toxin-antitoxin stability system